MAKHFNTCILSADSRQFYTELNIGTAKPTIEEQAGIKHHFIHSNSITDEMTSGRYEQEALALLEKEFQSKDVIVLTGGSGMFIDALCIGLDNIPSSTELRDCIQNEFDTNGIEPLLEELKLKDLVYFNEVDQSNSKRIIRAIEVIRLTNKTYSELRKAEPKKRFFEVHRYVIDHDREVLYDRINQRVDQMMAAGLLSEVKSVVEHKSLASLNTVGYKELFDYLEDKCTLDEAIELIKRNTRRYAKRQLTWFRRHPDAKWIDYITSEQMKDEIITHFNSKYQTMN